MSFFKPLDCHVKPGFKLPSGHVVEEIDPLTKAAMDFAMKHDTTGLFYNLQPGNWKLPIQVIRNCEELYKITYRPGDVMVNTFPKSGTTWMQEIVWTMRHNPDLDNPEADLPLYLRVLFMEGDVGEEGKNIMLLGDAHPVMQAFRKHCPEKDPAEGVFASLIQAIPGPRELRTHVSFPFLHPSLLEKAKVVFVVRDPRDVFISLHHFWKIVTFAEFIDDFDSYLEYFISDSDNWFWNSTMEGWKLRDHPNFYWVYYEDLLKDTAGELRKLDKFLETNLTEAQLKNVEEYCSFTAMKNRHNEKNERFFSSGMFRPEEVAKRGTFFRKAAVGDWKNVLTEDQQKRFNAWIARNTTEFPDEYRYKIKE